MGRWRFILVQLLVISAGAVAQVVELDKSDVPVDVESGVQQIHIAQGIDPTTMVISWLTPNYTAPAPASQVRYGLDPDNLDWLITNQDAFTYPIPAGYAKQDQKSPYPDYTSGWLHNVELRNLQPNTLYYYQCGDFSILPSNGDDYPYTPPTFRDVVLQDITRSREEAQRASCIRHGGRYWTKSGRATLGLTPLPERSCPDSHRWRRRLCRLCGYSVGFIS